MTERRPSGPVVPRCIEVNRYHPVDQHFEAGRLEHRRVVGGCRHPGQAGAHLGEPGRAGSIEALQDSGSVEVGVVGDEAQRIAELGNAEQAARWRARPPPPDLTHVA